MFVGHLAVALGSKRLVSTAFQYCTHVGVNP